MSIAENSEFLFETGTEAFRVEVYSNGIEEVPIVRTHGFAPRLLKLDEVNRIIELLEEYRSRFTDKDISNYDIVLDDRPDIVSEINEQGLISRRKLNVNPGWVYLVHAIDIGLYKIGCSKHPEQRLQQFLKQQIPSRLEMLCKISTSHMVLLEKKLHEKYEDQRRHGEWFQLRDENVREMIELAEGSSYL